MARVRNECASWMTNNQGQIGWFHQFRWWRKVRDDPNWFLYLLWCDETPVGYGIIHIKHGMHWLTGGIVRQKRGQGLGRKLFSELTAISTKSSAAYLEVQTANQRAINLYTSLGYRPIGEWREGVLTMSAYPR